MKRRIPTPARAAVPIMAGALAAVAAVSIGCGSAGSETPTDIGDAAPSGATDGHVSQTDGKPSTTPGPVDGGTVRPGADSAPNDMLGGDATAPPLADGATPPSPDGGATATAGAIVTVPLTGCADNGYAARFAVGAQTFDLIVDTGSGTLAVASTQCADCQVMPEYAPGSTAVDQHVQTSSTYGTGSWSGEVYDDQVDLAGLSPRLTMKIGAIRSQTQFFSDAGCSLGAVPYAPQGIAGFGPQGLTAKNTDAFLAGLASAGAAIGVFAVELCSSGGQLMMGGVDADAGHASGPGVFTPMVRSPYYAVTLDDLKIGGTSAGFGAMDFGTTIVDTGSTQLVLPTAIYNAVTAAIEAAPAFATAFGPDKSWFGRGECSTSGLTRAQIDAQLPTLTLVLPDANGGTNALTFKATDSYLPAQQLKGAIYYCTNIGVSPATGVTILGDAVMSTHIVVFDTQNRQIGFVPQSYCR